MKSLALALTMTTIASVFADVHPYQRYFPKDLTMHVTFDDGTYNPCVGLTEIRKGKPKDALFAPGYFGLGLTVGWLRWNQDERSPLIDTTKPGTVVVWVQNTKMPPKTKIGLGVGEAGGGFFTVYGPDEKVLTMGKTPDEYWGRGCILMSYMGKRPTGEHFHFNSRFPCTFEDWKEGEWRMIAGAWSAGTLSVSVNGEPFRTQTFEVPMVPMKGAVCFRGAVYRGPDTPPVWWTLDECAIFSRKLSDAEIAKLYRKMVEHFERRVGREDS